MGCPIAAPPMGAGHVRLIRIGAGETQIDLQPCGGTHVATTGEIGPFGPSVQPGHHVVLAEHGVAGDHRARLRGLVPGGTATIQQTLTVGEIGQRHLAQGQDRIGSKQAAEQVTIVFQEGIVEAIGIRQALRRLAQRPPISRASSA